MTNEEEAWARGKGLDFREREREERVEEEQMKDKKKQWCEINCFYCKEDIIN